VSLPSTALPPVTPPGEEKAGQTGDVNAPAPATGTVPGGASRLRTPGEVEQADLPDWLRELLPR
jgi:hypothetical protein